MIRALVISALLRLTALLTSSSRTISTTNARRAGLSNAMVQPPTSATSVDERRPGASRRTRARPSATDCAIAIDLHDDEQLALVGAVGDEAGPGAEHQHRAELAGREHADGEAAVGEVQDEQGLGDERQPVADLRDQLAEEEQAEVADVQRLEGVAGGSCRFAASSSSHPSVPDI